MAEEEVIKEESIDSGDNSVLRKEIESLRQEISSIKGMISGISSGFSSIKATGQQQNPTNAAFQAPNLSLFSTGNRGVPTDRQTDNKAAEQAKEGVNQDMLAMVESLKSDLKIKFRNMTKQEFKVFSAIYILEEQGEVDYKTLAGHLGLTEGSIRDYMMKLQNKGIPVVKTKVNNKKVLLNVRQELRQIASLSALMQIREPFFR